MPSRIDVQSVVADARAIVKKKQFEGLGIRGKIRSVAIVDSYVIDAALGKKELERAGQLLANPLLERFSINSFVLPEGFDPVKPSGDGHGVEPRGGHAALRGASWAIEIGPRPGVTDNVGGTAREVLEDGLGKKFKAGEKVYASQVFFISGRFSKADAETIANTLYNPLIQRAVIKERKEFARGKRMGITVPKVKLGAAPAARVVNLEVSDEELTDIGRIGILAEGKRPARLALRSVAGRRGPLALDLESMRVIREHFRKLKRKPTDIELESIAQTWSEHCKHTIFANPFDDLHAGLFKTYIKAATEKIMEHKKDFCVSVFKDNSGAIAFDDTFLITHKVETHNSPSALDPFGGAITGIVGVNRDTLGFGLGAKPVINMYGFCFACPEDIRGADPNDMADFYRDAARTQKLLSARRIMNGVIAGVNSGGNCSGIPTPQGFVWFDARYRAKPGVFVGTVGLIPRKVQSRKLYEKCAKPGDYIVMAGGRVGLDGIHGATFSSVALDPASPAAAVQIGDPITQKKLSDVLVKEARDRGLYTSVTDDGAGGLSCSVAEMAKESGGCRVELDKVPLKYPGLEPWQIWISESQERMTLAVPKTKWKELSSLFARRGVEATVIGTFTSSGRCVVEYKGKTIMDMEMEFLHEGWVRRDLYSFPETQSRNEPPEAKLSMLPHVLLRMLARPNIASTAFISMQYDHEVQAGSVTKPLVGKGRVNADATVTRPVLDSKQAVVLSQGLYPTYSEIDAYGMAAAAIDTAVRAAIVAGADPERIALLDNFCWCSSYEPKRLAELKAALRACYDTAVAFEAPFISGKDSMFNDFKGFDAKGKPVSISILPTLLISAIGIAEDAEKCLSPDFKFPGDLLYILGETRDELGGSEYAVMESEREKREAMGNSVPGVDVVRHKKLYAAFAKAARRGLVASAISVGRGGLGVACMKSAMGGMLGFNADLSKLPGQAVRDDAALFGESQGRILVSVNPKRKKEFEAVMRGNAHACVGKVSTHGEVRMHSRSGKKLSPIKLKDALRAYRSTFRNY